MTQLIVRNKELNSKEWIDQWISHHAENKELSGMSYTTTYVYHYIFRGSRKVKKDCCNDNINIITDALKSYQKLKHMYK
jgi:hypothetical protein